MTDPTHTTTLRALIDDRLPVHWARFAADHPHLAAALEDAQPTLAARVTQELVTDTEIQAALDAAAIDAATLTLAARLLQRVDHLLQRTLPT